MNTEADACQYSLVKGQDRFLVRYDAGCEGATISQLMQWAEDPDLEFDWFDAAVLSRQINLRLLGRAAGTPVAGEA
jgi:hypothetical protein